MNYRKNPIPFPSRSSEYRRAYYRLNKERVLANNKKSREHRPPSSLYRDLDYNRRYAEHRLEEQKYANDLYNDTILKPKDFSRHRIS